MIRVNKDTAILVFGLTKPLAFGMALFAGIERGLTAAGVNGFVKRGTFLWVGDLRCQWPTLTQAFGFLPSKIPNVTNMCCSLCDN